MHWPKCLYALLEGYSIASAVEIAALVLKEYEEEAINAALTAPLSKRERERERERERLRDR